MLTHEEAIAKVEGGTQVTAENDHFYLVAVDPPVVGQPLPIVHKEEGIVVFLYLPTDLAILDAFTELPAESP